jgi:hypothetical protein
VPLANAASGAPGACSGQLWHGREDIRGDRRRACALEGVLQDTGGSVQADDPGHDPLARKGWERRPRDGRGADGNWSVNLPFLIQNMFVAKSQAKTRNRSVEPFRISGRNTSLLTRTVPVSSAFPINLAGGRTVAFIMYHVELGELRCDRPLVALEIARG